LAPSRISFGRISHSRRSIILRLLALPFGEQALRHFLFREQPEGVDLKDATVFEALGEEDSFQYVSTNHNNHDIGWCY